MGVATAPPSWEDQRMRARLLPLAAVVAIAAAVVPAAPSAAATAPNSPILLGDGGHVDVATGPDGTGYAVWTHQDTPGHNGTVEYCRIRRGSRSCDATHVFTLDGQEDIGSRPYVLLPGGSTVVVLAHECCFSAGDPGYKGQADHTVV